MAKKRKKPNKPLTEVAEAMWRQLALDHSDPFVTSKARIFAISAQGFTRLLATDGDVYDGLERVSTLTLNTNEIGIGVETCGWAAPVDDDDENDADLPPSVHPKRRRCRLVSVVNTRMEAGSALGFSDEPDNIITDDGKATGSLAEALVRVIHAMVSANN
jgi:hypothetical protein